MTSSVRGLLGGDGILTLVSAESAAVAGGGGEAVAAGSRFRELTVVSGMVRESSATFRLRKDFVYLGMLDAGTGVHLGPGERHLLSVAAPFFVVPSENTPAVFRFDPGAEVFVAGLPAERIEAEALERLGGFGLLSPDSSLAGPVLAFLRTSLEVEDVSSIAEYSVETLGVEMFTGLFFEHAGFAATPSPERPGSLFDRAFVLIAARAQDPFLTPDAVAELLNVSTRQLYRAFSSHEVPVARVIRERRVKLARGFLADPAYDVLSLDQIAGYSGFASLRALRRALADAGLASPAALRRSR